MDLVQMILKESWVLVVLEYWVIKNNHTLCQKFRTVTRLKFNCAFPPPSSIMPVYDLDV